VDSYGRVLAEVVAQLQHGEVACSVRGGSRARFVFAERGSRAAELSCSGSGWWVEFWTGEAVVGDRTFSSIGEAVQAVRTWLTPDLAEQGAAADRPRE
jgi:hypothetical protein